MCLTCSSCFILLIDVDCVFVLCILFDLFVFCNFMTLFGLYLTCFLPPGRNQTCSRANFHNRYILHFSDPVPMHLIL